MVTIQIRPLFIARKRFLHSYCVIPHLNLIEQLLQLIECLTSCALKNTVNIQMVW